MTKVFSVSFYHVNSSAGTVIHSEGRSLQSVIAEDADINDLQKTTDLLKSKSVLKETAAPNDFNWIKNDKKLLCSSKNNIPKFELEIV